MSIHDAANDFLKDLKINLNELAERDSVHLWNECEVVEQGLEGMDEATLSVLNRVAQAAYYKSLDTMHEALRLTLYGDDDTPLHP